MKETQLTYKSFLKKMERVSAPLVEGNVEGVIQHFKLPNAVPSRFAPVTFLLDYTTRKYLYIDKNCCYNVMGYTAEYFLEMGLDDFNSKWHPSDFDVLNTKVFYDNFSFFREISPENYFKYIVSYNYRFKNPTGEYNTVLQRFSYLPGTAAGDLVGIVGVAFDISHFKNDTSIVHTIETVEESRQGAVNQLIFKKVHPVMDEPENKLLSRREREILSLMAKGFSSKQIAAHAGISVNTVNNHRKNMLNRTNCKSSSELMSYASKHGLA